MFYFSMDVKDASQMNISACKLLEIFEDHDFFEKFISEFIAKNPDSADEGEDAFYDLEELREDRYFRVNNYLPANVGEALEFTKKFSFFPPIRIWLNGEEHDISNFASNELVRVKS